MFKKMYFVMFSMLFVFGCSAPFKPQSMQATWLSRMHRMSAALANLMPYTADNKKYFDPQNTAVIKHNIQELSEASVELAQDSTGPKDPLIAHTAKVFSQDMSYALNQFKNGNTQTSQYLISNAAVYCITCHTRRDQGTKDFPIKWAVDLKNLKDSQKTQYFLANRQYKAAVGEVKKVLKDGTLIKEDPIQWRTSIERTMAMLVRVEKSPQMTREIAQAIVKNPSVPSYMRSDAELWLSDIQDWLKSGQNAEEKMSDRQKYNLSVKLIEAGRAKQKPQSHSPLISGLRASGLLHEILENPKSSYYPESLYTAGIVSEVLRDLTIWSLNETYYEACIQAKPHTRLSMKCYEQMESAVQGRMNNGFEMSGAAQYEKGRLENLAKLASIVDPDKLDRVLHVFDRYEKQQDQKSRDR